MPTVQDVLATLERLAPKRHALSFDKVGLQVGNPDAEVRKAVVAMDRSLGAVAFTREQGAQLLLTHHPLIFQPISSVDTRTYEGRTIIEMIKGDINFIAAHTNWDAAIGGINDELVRLFDVKDAEPFGMTEDVHKLKLVVFCPHDCVDAVLDAVAVEGAGEIGDYRRCAHMVEGRGTFAAGDNTHPAVGAAGQTNVAHEVRLEIILPAAKKDAMERAVRRVHTYEEPAFDFLAMAPIKEQPLGRIGNFENTVTLGELAAQIDRTLGTRCWAWGERDRQLRRVALVGGAADDDWRNAKAAGADVMITGEVRQHVALEASESGLCILACGHYATEHPGSAALCRDMAAAMPEIEWTVFVPPAGLHGRPF